MLKHLEIKDYALIDGLEMEFAKGFNVITGETGAGKSIIMGALNLVLGARADAKSIRGGAKKCVVEAVFADVNNDRMRELFADAELDWEDDIVLRREVAATGKSRAFVNDTPVTLQQSQKIGSLLLDIHSQHENLLLNNPDFQLDVIDKMADNALLVADYKDNYKNYESLVAELSALREEAVRTASERDYAQFQYDSLNEAQLVAGEVKELEAEQQTLAHSEDIKSEMMSVISRLDDDQCGVLTVLKEAERALQRASAYKSDLEEFRSRVESAYVDLKDVSSELNGDFSRMDYDPRRKQWVDERLDILYSLMQKHRCNSDEELIALRDEYGEKLQRIDGFDEEIARLERDAEKQRDRLQKCAENLSVSRSAVMPKVEDYLVGRLVSLGMPQAQFKIEHVKLDDFSAKGIDGVRFCFSANKNMPLRAISSIASGGEIARVMLSLKSLLMDATGLQAVVFDEIDTGVSGEIATRIGLMMSDIAQSKQVITITHLPQIAAQGERHFKVYKSDDTEMTVTNVVEIVADDRIMEIAEMLSGKNPTPSAIANAKELIQLTINN